MIDMIEFDSSSMPPSGGSVIVKNGESWEEAGIWLPSSRWPVSLFTLNGVLYVSFTYQTKVTDLVNTQAGMGLYHLENGQWLLETIPGIQCKRVHQMSCLEDGRVYVATYLRGVQPITPTTDGGATPNPTECPTASRCFPLLRGTAREYGHPPITTVSPG